MDNEHDFKGADFEFKGKHFEAKAVSRGEFEALKRFGDYEELRHGTLMRVEGEREFRIYCEDVEGFPFGLITPGFCSMFSEVHDERHGRNKGSKIAMEKGE